MTLIPIGRFSQMTRLSVKALRHYDHKGLLVPAHVDPDSRYRYYQPEQTRDAEVIRTLRSIDMPVEEIRAVLGSTDRAAITRLLQAHQQRLTTKVAAQHRMLAYLESIIHRKEILVSYEINVVEVASQSIAAVQINTSLDRIGADIQCGFRDLVQGLSDAGVTPAGSPLLVYQDVIDEHNDGTIEVCAPVAEDFQGKAPVYGRTLEGGNVATTVHEGPYESIGPAYQALGQWIAENGHEIVGPPREIYENDPQLVAPEALRTRVEFPVR